MSERPKLFEPSEIFSFAPAFLGASSRRNSGVSFRRFLKALRKPLRRGRNQLAFSACYGDSPVKTASVVWLRPLTSCKPLDATFAR